MHFQPGAPAPSGAVSWTQWRDTHIQAYGAALDLIIYTCNGIQTISLNSPASAAAVNGTNGYICVGTSNVIEVYAPNNLRWALLTTFECKSRVRCVAWAESECEIFVGTEKAVLLFHVESLKLRWEKSHANPVTSLAVSHDGCKFVSYSGDSFDSYAKVWMRINYEENTLFDYVYVSHDRATYISQFKWRHVHRPNRELPPMRNMRNHLPQETSHDVLYTFTADGYFNVWTTYEMSGHIFLRCCQRVNLGESLSVSGAFVDLKNTLGIGKEGEDLVFVFGTEGEIVVYIISEDPTASKVKVKMALRSTVDVEIKGDMWLFNGYLVARDQEAFRFYEMTLKEKLKVTHSHDLSGLAEPLSKLRLSNQNKLLLICETQISVWEKSGDSTFKRAHLDLSGKKIADAVSFGYENQERVVGLENDGSLFCWNPVADSFKILSRISDETFSHAFMFVLAPSIVLMGTKSGQFRAWKISHSSAERLPVDPPSTNCSYFSSDSAVFALSDGKVEMYRATYKGKVQWANVITITTNMSEYRHFSASDSKLALADSETLSIWNLKTGNLEYRKSFNDVISLVGWANVGVETTQFMLIVVFSHHAYLMSPLRHDYTNNVPAFAVFKQVDISPFTSYEIDEVCVFRDATLAIGCKTQLFFEGNLVKLNAAHTTSQSADALVSQMLVGYSFQNSALPVSSLVSVLNGPLPLYHPQFLIQALFMNELPFVKGIFVELLRQMRVGGYISWDLGLDVLKLISQNKAVSKIHRRLSSVLKADTDVFGHFNSTVAELLVQRLTQVALPLLTRHQQNTLVNLVNIVERIDKLWENVDENSIRYVVGYQLFQASKKQPKMTPRDANWAFHSDQKEMLYAMVEGDYLGRLTWSIAKDLGLTFWVQKQRLAELIENIAQKEFSIAGNPSGLVSVLYLAIQKKHVLLGLWRTVSHPERLKMLKFLGNNFSEDRWKLAATKNAFALMGKHRFLDAALFFLLAGKVKESCVTLCEKADVLLALAVADLHGDHDALAHVLEKVILPKAMEEENRWIASWVYAKLGEKENAMRALVKPQALEFRPSLGQIFKDDPALTILYRHLRKTTASAVLSPSEEFDVIVKLATLYTEMGCDYLALLLLQTIQIGDFSDSQAPLQFESFQFPKTEQHSPKIEQSLQPFDMAAFDF